MPSFGLVEVLIIGIIGIVVIVPFWKIFSKAGVSGWLSVTQVIPIVNFVVLFYVAFAEWPIQRTERQRSE